MGVGDWLRKLHYGEDVPEVLAAHYAPPLTDLKDRRQSDLLNHTLPRGLPFPRPGQQDRVERAQWAAPEEIEAYLCKHGDIILGTFNGQLIGHMDDKPMITVASARAGKTSTVLTPTLLNFPGSCFVLDPKGELATETAKFRHEVLGQNVYVLDPFGCSGEASAHLNPLKELDPEAETIVDDVDTLVDALVVDEGTNKDPHWIESTKQLIRGLILYTLTMKADERNLVTVHRLLTLTHPDLKAAYENFQRDKHPNPAEATRNALFVAMRDADNDVFGDALAEVGASFLEKPIKERGSIISTAMTQLRFLASKPMQRALSKSDFSLADLAAGNTTVYLCLPAGRLATQSRWLRLLVSQTLTTLEGLGRWPRDRLPMLFLMEEFAYLGHMPIMEQAAAYFPGFGVKLWAVLQDLNQLQRNYRDGWQTFLGNASVVQFFANADGTTLNYLSERLGRTSFALGGQALGEDAKHKEHLLHAHELARIFARQTDHQGLLIEGSAPIATTRLTHEEVAHLRKTITARAVERREALASAAPAASPFNSADTTMTVSNSQNAS